MTTYVLPRHQIVFAFGLLILVLEISTIIYQLLVAMLPGHVRFVYRMRILRECPRFLFEVE